MSEIPVQYPLEGEILLIDKPIDWTSFDVVKKIRIGLQKKYNLKKIKVGHAGTLDPKATGLLIVCTGGTTKKIDNIQNQPKTYTGIFKLGATTPSYDRELEEEKQYSISHILESHIYSTAKQFVGNIQQKPPLYSAIKKNGQKLYQIARAGKSIDIEPRPVVIYSFDITEINLPYVSFKVECSKGTYIRSLAYDFGQALQSGAYLWELRRTKIGEYDLSQADSSCLYS